MRYFSWRISLFFILLFLSYVVPFYTEADEIPKNKEEKNKTVEDIEGQSPYIDIDKIVNEICDELKDIKFSNDSLYEFSKKFEIFNFYNDTNNYSNKYLYIDSLILKNPKWFIDTLCTAFDSKVENINDSCTFLSEDDTADINPEKILINPHLRKKYSKYIMSRVNKLLHLLAIQKIFNQLLTFDFKSFDKKELNPIQENYFYKEKDIVLDSLYRRKIINIIRNDIFLSAAQKYQLIIDQIELLVKDSIFVTHASSDALLDFLLIPFTNNYYTRDGIMASLNKLHFINNINPIDSMLLFRTGRNIIDSSIIDSNSILNQYYYYLNDWLRKVTENMRLKRNDIFFSLYDYEETKKILINLIQFYKKHNKNTELLIENANDFFKVMRKMIEEVFSNVNFQKIDTMPPLTMSSKIDKKEKCINYLKGRSVNCMVYGDSILWIGTSAGLVKYNILNREEYFFTVCNSSIPYNNIRSLTLKGKKVLIGTKYGGLVELDGKKWKVLHRDTEDTPFSSDINILTTIDSNTIWLNHWRGGLLRIKGKDTLFFTKENYPFLESSPNYIMVDKNNNVWIGGNNYIGRFDGERWTIIDTTELPIKGVITSIAQDSSGAIWLCVNNNLVYFTGEKGNIFYITYLSSSIYSKCVAVDPLGNIWVGGEGGLLCNKNKNWYFYQFFKDKVINAIEFDKAGNTWIGTNDGLYCIDNKENCFYIPINQSGFSERKVFLVSDFKYGRIVAVDGRRVYLYKDGKWNSLLFVEKESKKNFYDSQKKDWGNIDTAFFDSRGRLWIFRDHLQKLFRVDTSLKEIESVNLPDEIFKSCSNICKDRIAFDSTGNFYVVCDSFLIRSDGIHFEKVKIFDAADSSLYVNSIHIDKKGEIWLGTSEKIGTSYIIFSIFNNKITQIITYNNKIRNPKILFCDTSSLWVIFNSDKGGDGLAVYNGKEWKIFELDNFGILGSYIYDVKIDKKSNVWIVASKGLFRYDGKKWWIYNSYKTGLEIESPTQILFDKWDNIWISTETELIKEKRVSFIAKGLIPSHQKPVRNEPYYFYSLSILKQDPDSALYYLNKAISQNSKEAEFFARRAEIYTHKDENKKAIADANKFFRLYKGDNKEKKRDVYFCRALSLQKLGKIKEALRDYNELLKLDSTYAIAYVNRAGCLLQTGELEKSLQDYSKALQFGVKESIDILISRAEILESIGKNKDALEDLNLAIKLSLNKSERNLKGYLLRAIIFNNIGKYDSTIQDCNKILSFYPTFIDAYLYRGIAYSNCKRYSEALSDFNKVLENYPNYNIALVSRAVAYFGLQKIPEALSDINKAISSKEKETRYEALKYRGIIYSSQKEIKKSNQDLRKAYRMDSTDVQVINYLGVNMIISGQYDKAIKMLEKAIKINPAYEQPYYNIACAYSLQKKFEPAIKYFKKALEAGFNNREHIEKDKDLDFIRGSKEYKELMEKFFEEKKKD